MAEHWPVYRVVTVERYATWTELEDMSIDDVDDLIEIADAMHAAERAASKRGR